LQRRSVTTQRARLQHQPGPTCGWNSNGKRSASRASGKSKRKQEFPSRVSLAWVSWANRNRSLESRHRRPQSNFGVKCSRSVPKVQPLHLNEFRALRAQVRRIDVKPCEHMQPMRSLEKAGLLHTQEARGSSPCAPTIVCSDLQRTFHAVQASCFSGRLSPIFFAKQALRLLLFSRTRQIVTATRVIQNCSKSPGAPSTRFWSRDG